MAKDIDKDHLNEIVETGIDTFQNIVAGFLPGIHVFHELINVGNKLKTKRLLNFAQNFKSAIYELKNETINDSNFTKEDFIEVFEKVLFQVQNTKSELKLERFRNILLNQLVDPQEDIDLMNKYIKILNELNDIQIHMIIDFRDWQNMNQKIKNIVRAYSGDIGMKQPDDYIIERLSNRVGYLVKKSDLEFYFNELIVLGLVRNIRNEITYGGADGLQNEYEITPFGLSFIGIIEISNDK